MRAAMRALLACATVIVPACARAPARACVGAGCVLGAPGRRALKAEFTTLGADVAQGGETSAGEAVIYSEAISTEITRDQFFDIFLTAIVGLMIIITFYELLVGPSALGQVFPTAAFSLFLGMLFGYLMRCLDLAEPEREIMKFSDRLFLFVLLPPIIYESAFMMDRKTFFHNCGTIMLIVIPGVVLSTGIIGCSAYWAGSAGLFTHEGRDPMDFSSPLEPMLFGSLISATDPVATLAILSTVKIPPVLFVLIFGESLLNDAVSIVLYKVLKWYGAEAFTWKTLPVVIGDFCAISIGSVLVGAGIGLLSAYIHKQLIERTFHSPSGEMTSIIMFGYISYTLAEAVNLSGITALVVAGICQRYYTFYSVSHEAQHASHYVLKLIASKAEQFVFLYLGINVFLVSGEGKILSASTASHREWGTDIVAFAAFMLFLCVISRLVMVVLLCSLANLRRTSRKIKFNEMLLMWWAGLRGAMAFALAKDLENEVVVSLTIVVVLFTTFVCGCSTTLVVRKLGLLVVDTPTPQVATSPSTLARELDRLIAHNGDDSSAQGRDSATPARASPGTDERHATLTSTPGPGSVTRRQSFQFLPTEPVVKRRQRHWDIFDRKYMRPIFGGPGIELSHLQATQAHTASLQTPVIANAPLMQRQRSMSISRDPHPPGLHPPGLATSVSNEHHHPYHGPHIPHEAASGLAAGGTRHTSRRDSHTTHHPHIMREPSACSTPSVSESGREKTSCILDTVDSSDEDEPLVLIYEHDENIQEGDEEGAEIEMCGRLPYGVRLAPREPYEMRSGSVHELGTQNDAHAPLAEAQDGGGGGVGAPAGNPHSMF